MTTPYLAGDVARDEGLRLEAYPDPLSPLAQAMRQGVLRLHGLSGAPWTIGHGHTGPEVREGLVWTPAEAAAALRADLDRACHLLDGGISWWRGLNDARQDVLANMCFNLGWDDPKTPVHEGLSGFVHTLEFIRTGHFDAAADGMLASKWAGQVHDRAKRLADQMRTGARAA